jgi:GH15 family glucan-1,4-alpha-glucosidase
MELVIRCEYGSIIPWVRRLDDGRLTAVAGPDRLTLSTPAEIHGENLRTIAEFEVKAGEEVPFSLTWSPSYRSLPAAADAHDTIEEATAGWLRWSRSHKAGGGEWSEAVLRSLITLKALTHVETGGIVAAATTSLPEQLGGPRNWDYVLLAAGCDVDPVRLDEFGLFRRGGGMARLAVARGRRGAAPNADHVRHRRGTSAGRVSGALA